MAVPRRSGSDETLPRSATAWPTSGSICGEVIAAPGPVTIDVTAVLSNVVV